MKGLFRRQPAPQVPSEGIEFFGKGEEGAAFQPGDFILTHGSGWASRLIRIGQSLRFHGKDSRYAYWNHAALIVSEKGDLVEALWEGVMETHISKYKPRDYVVVRVAASAEDREEEVNFARYCVNEEYGLLTLASIGLSLATGSKLSFGLDGQVICSGLVARSLERTAVIFSKSPAHIAPADLAQLYEVEMPAVPETAQQPG